VNWYPNANVQFPASGLKVPATATAATLAGSS
jgi:hypothetical protein